MTVLLRVAGVEEAVLGSGDGLRAELERVAFGRARRLALPVLARADTVQGVW